MAPETWSDLPSDILATITKILNTDVDILRLRSVCSSWRSSVPPRPRPSSFPLILPPLSVFVAPNLCAGSRCQLSYSTLYRLSRPEHGPQAGDPSDSWLLRVSEVNPNRFALLCPLVPDRVSSLSPGLVPKCLNLLEFRITEICKSYGLKWVNAEGFAVDLLRPAIRKVTVLWNYTADCDFVVLALFSDFTAKYWKFGDKDWTAIDTKGYGIVDLAFCKGKCYALTRLGMLYEFDSDMKLNLAHMAPLLMNPSKSAFSLVEYKSELYVVRRIYEDIDAEDDETGHEPVKSEVKFRCEVFKKCKNWEPVRCLGDAVFLSCVDVSVGFSAEGFGCCKGNSAYVAIELFIPDQFGRSFKHFYSGVHSLASGQPSCMKLIKEPTFVYWPPPRWLISS